MSPSNAVVTSLESTLVAVCRWWGGGATLECGGVWSKAGVQTRPAPDGPPPSAYRKHEVTFSGFGFVGVGYRTFGV